MTPTIKNQKPQLQVKKLRKYFRVQSLSILGELVTLGFVKVDTKNLFFVA
jgi:hypothetical protein